MEKAPEYEISPLSRRAIAARTGFHNYVIEARENDPNIVDKEQIVVDINVSGIDDAKNFHSFTEIEREYEELSIEAEHSDFDELNLDLMRQQIAADKVLARILSGQKVDFDEFHRITRGYGPEFAPEEGILQKRVKLDKLLHQRGLGYSHDPEYANGFNELYLIKNPEDVETGILRELRLSRLELAKFKPVYADEIRPSFVCDADIPWAGHMSTDETKQTIYDS